MQQISYKIYESSPEIKLFHGLYNSLKTYRINNCFEREGFRETITPVIGSNIGLFDNNVIISYNVDGRGRFIKISTSCTQNKEALKDKIEYLDNIISSIKDFDLNNKIKFIENYNGIWNTKEHEPIINLENLYLSSEISKKINDGIKRFHKEGKLNMIITGKSGTGKSTIVKAISSLHQLNSSIGISGLIYRIIPEPNLDQTIMSLIEKISFGSILLFDNIEQFVNVRNIINILDRNNNFITIFTSKDESILYFKNNFNFDGEIIDDGRIHEKISFDEYVPEKDIELCVSKILSKKNLIQETLTVHLNNIKIKLNEYYEKKNQEYQSLNKTTICLGKNFNLRNINYIISKYFLDLSD